MAGYKVGISYQDPVVVRFDEIDSQWVHNGFHCRKQNKWEWMTAKQSQTVATNRAIPRTRQPNYSEHSLSVSKHSTLRPMMRTESDTWFKIERCELTAAQAQFTSGMLPCKRSRGASHWWRKSCRNWNRSWIYRWVSSLIIDTISDRLWITFPWPGIKLRCICSKKQFSFWEIHTVTRITHWRAQAAVEQNISTRRKKS